MYEMRECGREWTVTGFTVADTIVAPQVAVYHVNIPQGNEPLGPVTVDAIDSLGRRVASSSPVVPARGPSPARIPLAGTIQPSSTGTSSQPSFIGSASGVVVVESRKRQQ